MKNFTIILMLALMVSVAAASLPFHNVQVLDEVGNKVTTISSVEIYAPDTSTDAVIYSDRALQNVITIPMTTGSTNTTLSNGNFFWYGPDGYDFSITDGSNIANNSGHRTRTSSEGRIIFPTYLTSISSTTYSDSQSATWGTSGDFVQSAGAVSGTLTFVPGADNNIFNIGTSGTGANADFNVFVGTLLGFEIDAGNPSLTWDGGAALLNHNSNFNVGINTGTSTGNTSLGSSTSGTVAIDTTAGVTINADDSIDMTTSGNTADIDIDAADGSVIIDGGEADAAAVTITATNGAGGVIVSCGTGDITLDSGDDIFLAADTGSGDVISIINTQGTNASSLIIRTVATGSVDIDSGEDVTVDVTDDILLTSGDDTVITTTGALTIANTETMTVSGALTVTGDTQLISVTRIDTPIEIVAAANEIEITESGTVYILTNSTEYATTLPTVASSSGVTYRFICGAVPSGDDYTVLTDTLEDKISGSVTVNGAAVAADGPDDTITFTRDAAAIGDWIELTSDGVLWYLSGQAVSATGIVPSKAD